MSNTGGVLGTRWLYVTSISLLNGGCVWIGDKTWVRLDKDSDGYINTQFGGDDCDDTNRAVTGCCRNLV